MEPGTSGLYGCVNQLKLLSFVAAFGVVLLVQKKGGPDAGCLYAVKALIEANTDEDPESNRYVTTEGTVLQAVRGLPFLVGLHYAFETEDQLYFVMGEHKHCNIQ
jgi:hypothetical protein